MKAIPDEVVSFDFDAYYSEEALFSHFFRCSLYNAWDYFDFYKAFEHCRGRIGSKLAEHGLLNFEDFEENFSQMYGDRPGDLSPFEWKSDYINITEEDIMEVILRHIFDESRKAFTGMFSELIEIYDMTDNPGRFDLPEQIELFDRVIHAQHVTEAIFDELNPDDLRADIEYEYENQPEIEENELSETINKFHEA